MADAPKVRGPRTIRLAQLLLVLAAVALWAAAQLPWVLIRSFDGLGQPRTTTLDGGAWSTALVPLALLLLAAAVAGLAVRGWPLRVLALLGAAASAAAAYLAISQWVVPDVAVRAADLAGVPVMFLVGSERRFAGAMLTLAAAACALLAAVLLMRSAATRRDATMKYVAPAARRSASRSVDAQANPDGDDTSERMLWDALDDGRDPTADIPPSGPGPDSEGR
jgi:uncharacterized membrane protein (TIGR02234 family)